MRVQIPAYTDRWMMGDRYGDVVKVKTQGIPSLFGTPIKREIASVKLDISGQTVRVILDDCTVV